MNEHLLDGINGIAGRSDALDGIITLAANEAIFVLAGLALLFGLVELKRDRGRAVQIAAAMCIAGALALGGLGVLGKLVVEARPFVHDADTTLVFSHSADNSFPSDHATVAAAIAVIAALAWRQWAAVFVALALLVGIARIAAGVHFPGDVAAGWLLGAAAAVAGWQAVLLVQAHRATGFRQRA